MTALVDWSAYPEAPFADIPEARHTYASQVLTRRLPLAVGWIVLGPLQMCTFTLIFLQDNHGVSLTRVLSATAGLFLVGAIVGAALQRRAAAAVDVTSAGYRSAINATWRNARFPGGKGFTPTGQAERSYAPSTRRGAKLSEQRWFQSALTLGILIAVPVFLIAFPVSPTRTLYSFLLVTLSLVIGFVFGANVTAALIALHAPGFKFPAANDGLVVLALGTAQRNAAYAAVYEARARGEIDG